MTTKDQNIFNGDDMDRKFINSKSIDEKIREIEDRIKNLTEKNIPDLMHKDSASKQSQNHLQEKLLGVTSNIRQLSDEIKTNIPETEHAMDTMSQTGTSSDGSIKQKLFDLQKRIESLDSMTKAAETTQKTAEIDRIIEERYNSLSSGTKKEDQDSKLQGLFAKDRSSEPKETAVKDKLESIDRQIRDIKDSITAFYTSGAAAPSSAIEEKLKSIEEKLSAEKPKTAHGVPHGPITIKPKKKKEGLFNDVNLTEDYELGFRFYQLGFRTGFFNVKLDRDDEASRIATAEFFPNTFWASVKQRSRWVAGIVFQNWKAHKWAGNLSTKYFLFRDRKSIFSFFSAFLSNIVILYFIYAIFTSVFGLSKPYSLVGNSSVLWYLMVANLIFMISRLSHRFVFTYNWYGFKYAFFSLFRLPLDTIINFFAIARSLNVYKNTKTQEKVVWDSTSHY